MHYQRPALYPAQARFVDCPARYTVVEASTKSGKTVACLVWLFEQAMRGQAGQNFWWVAPIYQQAAIAFRRLRLWLSQSQLPAHWWSASVTRLSISLVNGTTLWFKSGEKTDHLFGEDVHAAVIDEASRCREEAWHAVRSTLTATRGPVKIIGNVNGRRNWAYRLARRAEAGEPEMAWFRLTAHDAAEAGILDAREIHDAQLQLPPHVFRELYLAQPTDDGCNPFGFDAIRACTLSELSTSEPSAFGIDLAKSIDWTVVCGLDAAGHVCCLERWQEPWWRTSERILQIVGATATLIDSTGPGDAVVEALARDRPTITGFRFSSQSKQQLMESLALAISRQQLGFPDGWLVRELEGFECQPGRTTARYTAGAGLHDDGVCALALAWTKLQRQRINPLNARVI